MTRVSVDIMSGVLCNKRVFLLMEINYVLGYFLLLRPSNKVRYYVEETKYAITGYHCFKRCF